MEVMKSKSERGQVLVFVVIAMIGLLAILALSIDGGTTFANRRAMQNAADAGALAGARTLCITKDSNQAVAVAREYATVRNEAQTADVTIDEVGMVTVTARITFNTFFARLIGRPQMTAEAVAASGCFPPTTGKHVLPIAWACRPPISESLTTSDDCQEQAITKEQLTYYVNNPPPPGEIYPELYIVMNSNAQPDDLASICISGGGWLQCDLDGDGEDDLIANGDRSWLDLDGSGGGASELIDWINNGFPGTITRHTWVGGQSGVDNSVFQAAGDHVGEIVAIPVFDLICDDYPDPRCSGLIHPQDTIVTTSGGSYYYHIISFAAFYIACVNAPGVPGPECPGHKVATDLGVIDNNTKTIEGYFLKDDIDPDLGGGDPGGIDTGVYTLRLYR